MVDELANAWLRGSVVWWMDGRRDEPLGVLVNIRLVDCG